MAYFWFRSRWCLLISICYHTTTRTTFNRNNSSKFLGWQVAISGLRGHISIVYYIFVEVLPDIRVYCSPNAYLALSVASPAQAIRTQYFYRIPFQKIFRHRFLLFAATDSSSGFILLHDAAHSPLLRSRALIVSRAAYDYGDLLIISCFLRQILYHYSPMDNAELLFIRFISFVHFRLFAARTRIVGDAAIWCFASRAAVRRDGTLRKAFIFIDGFSDWYYDLISFRLQQPMLEGHRRGSLLLRQWRLPFSFSLFDIYGIIGNKICLRHRALILYSDIIK